MATPIKKVDDLSSDWIDSDSLHYDHVTGGDLTAELFEEPHFQVVENTSPLSQAYVDKSLNEDSYALLFGPLIWEEQNADALASSKEVFTSAPLQLDVSEAPLSFNEEEGTDTETTSHETNPNPLQIPFQDEEQIIAEDFVFDQSVNPPGAQDDAKIDEDSPKQAPRNVNIFGELIPSSPVTSEESNSEGKSHKTLRTLGIFTLIISLGTVGFLTLDFMQGGTYMKKLKEIDFGRLFHNITHSHLGN